MIKHEDILKNKLYSSSSPRSEKRYYHSLRVVDTALKLNNILKLGLNSEKVFLASIYHDYGKFMTIDDCKRLVSKYHLDSKMLEINEKLWHSFFGCYLVQEELGLCDQDVINAIKFHTTGTSNMTSLEEIIFLADYIEEGREGEEFEDVRSIAFNEKNLKKAVAKELKYLIKHLENEKKVINKYTLEAYDYYKIFLE